MDVRYVQEQTIPETEVIIIPATKSPKEKKKQGRDGLLHIAASARTMKNS